MARFQKEEHHIIPLSVGGPNWTENTHILNQKAHQSVHETLDIPHGLLRRYRKRTNHLTYMDTYWVGELEKLQNLYFARLSFLPMELQTVHYERMIDIHARAVREYGIKLDWEPTTGTTSQLFHEKLRHYHAILYKIGARNQSLLPAQFHPTA